MGNPAPFDQLGVGQPHDELRPARLPDRQEPAQTREYRRIPRGEVTVWCTGCGGAVYHEPTHDTICPAR